MRAALYIRVSTLDQHPDMQLRELREFAARRGWEIAGEYLDEGVSGGKETRPQLSRLLEVVRRRAVDAVLVWRFDRFARSTRQLVSALAEFDSLNVQFVSLHEQIDTSTPQGRLVYHLVAAIAEFERELIRERVRSGIAAARARGRRIGRPRRTVDAAKIARLRATGLSWRAICIETGLGKGTAQRAFYEARG